MSIGISDDHVELAASLRKWAAGVRGLDAVRAAEDDPAATFEEIWAAVGEMGLATIGLPESAGGGGGSVLDVAVALEACAHELVPGPLLGPAVAAALLGESSLAGELAGGAVVGLVLGDVVWDAPVGDAPAACRRRRLVRGAAGCRHDRLRPGSRPDPPVRAAA